MKEILGIDDKVFIHELHRKKFEIDYDAKQLRQLQKEYNTPYHQTKMLLIFYLIIVFIAVVFVTGMAV